MGKVTFVGAGPYDDRFLTLAGQMALEDADCVLYDHLLDASMLRHTKKECIFVGKKGHHPSMTQAQINALLIEKAHQHRHVVRLKGGDSFVFGRGGEEALALQAEQIGYCFVPGITSPIAVCEMAGIPVTHRGYANGFLVLSAHLQDHELNIPIEQVKNEKITLIFLMGNSRLAQIVSHLIMAGRKKETPIAIISKGCSPQQRVVCGTLDTILAKASQEALSAPAIIVVGDVVPLRNQIYPYQVSPLYQKRILVYKMERSISSLTTLLWKQGAIVEEVQCGEIVVQKIEDVKVLIETYRLFIFTSKHAIHAFFKAIYQSNLDARALVGRQFACIGEKSAMVLQQYGILADIIGNGNHEQLEERLRQTQIATEQMLHLQGRQSESVVVDGIAIPSLIVYENKVFKPTNPHQDYDVICFTCASSVQRCPLDVTKITCVAIGETTRLALLEKGCQHIIMAKTPSYEAMVEALLQKENSDVSR